MKSVRISGIYGAQQLTSIILQFSIIYILGLSANYDKYIVASTVFMIVSPILESVLVPLVATSMLELRSLFSTIFWLGAITAFINAVLGSFLLSIFFPSVMISGDNSVAILNTWFSLAIFLSFLVSFYKGYLIALGEQIPLSWLGLSGTLLQCVFVLYFLPIIGIQGLVMGIVLSNTVYIANMVFKLSLDRAYFQPVIEVGFLKNFCRLILSGLTSKTNVIVDRVYLSRMQVGMLSTAFVGEKVVRIAADAIGKGLNWTSLSSEELSYRTLAGKLNFAALNGLVVWVLFVVCLSGLSSYLSSKQIYLEYLVAIRFAMLMSPIIVFGLINVVLTNFFYVESRTKELATLNVFMQLLNVAIRIGIIVLLDFDGVALGYWIISMLTSIFLLIGLYLTSDKSSKVLRNYAGVIALLGSIFVLYNWILLNTSII